MDEENTTLRLNIESKNFIATARDENISPTSGSSSETFADGNVKSERNRKARRNTKRKRKWKPYSALSWDEKKVQDDRESRRAFAKRERLSAEGHPIAPYNTTQFLMEDRKGNSPNCQEQGHRPTAAMHPESKMPISHSSQSLQDLDEDSMMSEESNHAHSLRASIFGKRLGEQLRLRYYADSPLTISDSPVGERGAIDGNNSNSNCGDDIQRFIMDDFSHTYAGFQAEELQSKSKAALIEDCLKLERKVDSLEKRVKECKRRHTHGTAQGDRAHLLEKINQLQALNSQLVKENASIPKSSDKNIKKTASDDGAQIEPANE